MNNKSVILSILLATTFLTPSVFASTPTKTTGAITYSAGTLENHDFAVTTTNNDGSTTVSYYKVNLTTDNLGSSYSLSDTEPEAATTYAPVTLPDGTTKYVVYNPTTPPTNTRQVDATGDLTGDFVGLNTNEIDKSNNNRFGGAINNNLTIGDITGDFVLNKADYTPNSDYNAKGGAIYNTYEIGNIVGDFVGNEVIGRSSAHGGAIVNEATGSIMSITGNFISNKSLQADNTNVRGGAIYNQGTIGRIIGDFINNSITTNSSYAYGGAIANVKKSGSANTGIIDSIQGSFIGNSVYAGKKERLAKGGAIYTQEHLTFKSGGQTQIISGNTTEDADNGKDYNAIYVNGTKTLTFDTSSGGAWIINDTIEGGSSPIDSSTNTYKDKFNLTIRGDDTVNEGKTSQYVAVNNALINAKYINIEGSTLKFGSYTHDDTSAAHAVGKGEFVSKADDKSAEAQLYLKNGVFDLANGYYQDVVKLNKYSSENGYVHLDVDTDEMSSDLIDVSGDIEGGNIIGKTKLIIHASSAADIRGKGEILFAQSTSLYDSAIAQGLFSVYRVYKSPYMFDINFASSEDDTYKSSWYLAMNNTVNNGQFVEDEEPDVGGGDDPDVGGGDDPDVGGGDDPDVGGGDDPDVGGGDDPDVGGGDDPDVGGGDDPDVGGGDDPDVGGGDDPDVGGGDDPDVGGGDDPDVGGGDDPDVGGGDEPDVGGGDEPDVGGGEEPGNNSSSVSQPLNPEIISAIALPTALAQSEGMIDNIMRNVTGLYSLKIVPTNNLWASTDYTGVNISAPVDVESKVWGFNAGADLQSDLHNKLGTFISYRKGTHEISGEGEEYYSTIASEIEIESYLAGLYYYHKDSNFYTFASIYGGIQKAELTTDDAMSFDTDGIELGAQAELGYSMKLGRNFVLTPSIGASYTRIMYDDAEDIAGKEDEFGDIAQAKAQASLKLSHIYKSMVGFGEFYVKPSIIQTFNVGDNTKITGLDEIETMEDVTLGRIEMGAQHNLTENFSVNTWGSYTYGSDYNAAAAGLGLKYNW